MPSAVAADCRLLILVPTRFERQQLERLVAARPSPHGSPTGAVRWSTIGFGPTIAGTMALDALRRHAPQQAVLAGIAGSLDERFPIGSVVEPDEVAIEGIGAWVDGELVGPARLGWRLWEGTSDEPPERCGEIVQPLAPFNAACAGMSNESASLAGHDAERIALLTVCAASGSLAQAAARKSAFPNAVAEEMEGHSVAVATRVAKVPLTIVRGISNIAGERDKRHWRIDAALEAVAARLGVIIDALSIDRCGDA